MSTPFVIKNNFTPYLTTSQNITQNPFPNYTTNQQSIPSNNNPPNTSTLQLTNNKHDHTNFAIFNKTLPFTTNTIIKFVTFTYNNTKIPKYNNTNNISIFLKNTTITTKSPNTFNNNLNYTQNSHIFNAPISHPPTNTNIPNNYIKININKFKNFSNNHKSHNYNCTPHTSFDLFTKQITLHKPNKLNNN